MSKGDSFDKLLDYYTKDYSCIVIDNFNNYKNSIDRIKYFKAVDLS